MCIVGPPLRPGFENELVHQLGCGYGSFYLVAYDEAEDVGMALRGVMSQEPTDVTVTLPDPSVRLEVAVGPGTYADYCSGPAGQKVRSYSATAGTVQMHLEPTTELGAATIRTETAEVTDIVLASDADDPQIAIPSYVFDNVEVLDNF
jgi:hypothetical protein